jgi:dienelactone hydrolase
LTRKLFKEGEIPPGMIYVDGYFDEVKNTWEVEHGFFIDKYEVTNKQFKAFVDKGGYRNSDYWKHEIIKEGEKLTWEDAMLEFTDNTGRPGPSTWDAGNYTEGQDDYPVTGVSWYEAAAYAEYAGKVLPTGDHWDSSAGFFWLSILNNIGPQIYPLSNINGKNPLPVGLKKAISCFGAYDMAGNAREWCYNESSSGRIISGSGWDDASYLFTFWSQLPPIDRSRQNGFRCAMYIDEERIPKTAFRLIEMESRTERDYSLEIPVPDNTFQVYKNQFLYDKTELNAKTEERDNTADDYIVEKVSFNAAYGNERMIAYLFIPRNVHPPYQTLIYWPGASAVRAKVFDKSSAGKAVRLEYILKNGRAILYPLYFRTYERGGGQLLTSDAHHSHQYTEDLIKWVKDFSRSIDYLETRNDIDIDKLALYGVSWGGRMGAIIPAVEERLAISILVLPGFTAKNPYPEATEINYVSRVRIPTLMLNGRYDSDFDLDNQVMPFYRLLGTPEADKRLCIFESGHYISQGNMIKEVLGWLDKYFGPPDYL